MSIGTALKDKIFSPGHTETPKFKNVHIYPEQKWLGFAMFSFFSVCQREIKKHSHLDHPVPPIEWWKETPFFPFSVSASWDTFFWRPTQLQSHWGWRPAAEIYVVELKRL